jgi:spore coat protein A
VVDFADVPVGGSVVLKNLGGKDGTANVMRFDVTHRVEDDSRVPPVLRPPKDQEDPTHLPADPSEAVRTRRWVFKRQHGYWSINGKIWDPDRIDAAPREGEVEIWEFVNNGGGWVHPIHLHMANFKILSRNGRAPRPWERGWKETVFLDGNETARVLIKFPEVPVEGTGEYTRRYAYHCHLVEHEDHDMMLQFEVRA